MKTLSLTLAALLLVPAALLASGFAGGTGTARDPYLVATAQHLNQVRNHRNAWFLQIEDIDLNVEPFNRGAYWIPIGGSRTNDDIYNNFTGHYDGNGFEIKNLIIVLPGSWNIGLFGHIGKGDNCSTTIKNVTLRDVIIIGGHATGSLVGRVTGNQNTRIENCQVINGYVRGDSSTGGLVGANNSFIANSVAAEGFRPVIYKCSANVSVLLRSDFSEGKTKFGGLVGCNQMGMVSHSISMGEVIANNNKASAVGGLAGCIDLRGMVINSYSVTSVYAETVVSKGGFIGSVGAGRNKGMVHNCYWNRAVNSENMPSLGVEGLSNQQMKKTDYFKGWDFSNTWQINPYINFGFPSFLVNTKAKIEKYWTGNKSFLWDDPNNWAPEGVPSENENITISPDAKNQPVITRRTSVRDITIHDFTSITLQGEKSSLEITGAFSSGPESVGSAVIKGEGTLVMSGTSLQSIPSITLNNLVINNPSNVQLSGNISITSMLNMQQGLLDLRGFDINLGENAFIKETENENNSARVYGSLGVIRAIRVLDAPFGEIAGLGLEIYSAAYLGRTIFERGHSALNGGDYSKSILRWFDIKPEVNTNLNATLAFHYYISELNVNGENSNFSLFKKMQGEKEWNWIPSELNPEKRIITAVGINEMGKWTAGSSDKPLPIVLFSWDAKVSGNAIQLSWITAAEINNDYFTIERSHDGRSFETIANIQGKGTTSQSTFYNITDNSPLEGISYYRLKQTDFNGDFEYSRVISVMLETQAESQVKVFPNPSNGQFNLLYSGQQVSTFRMVDMQGRVVKSGIAEPGIASHINLSQLKQGLYTIIFSDFDSTTVKVQIN